MLEGDQSALLPCRTRFFSHYRVEWRRVGSSNTVVHVYHNYQHQSKLQEQNSQENRTKMEEDLLKTEDLSLTLYKPRPSDSGVYVCNVYGRENWKAMTVVVLIVGESCKHTSETRNISAYYSLFSSTYRIGPNIRRCFLH